MTRALGISAILVTLLNPRPPTHTPSICLQIQAEQDRDKSLAMFLVWAESKVEGARRMNVASDHQVGRGGTGEAGGQFVGGHQNESQAHERGQ